MTGRTAAVARPAVAAIATVPPAVPLVAVIVLAAFSPVLGVIAFVVALALAVVAAGATALLVRSMRDATAGRFRLHLAARVTAAWVLALGVAPLLVILGSPLLLLGMEAIADLSTTASRTPQFETYLPLLVGASPLAGLGWLAALAFVPFVSRGEPARSAHPG